MTSPISSATLTLQQAAAASVTSKASTAQAATKVESNGNSEGSTTHVAVPTATKVTISAAGLAAAAASKEASETPAQTAQEARGTDMQAKRLLAREEAAAKAARA